jgi:hypothetical protein
MDFMKSAYIYVIIFLLLTVELNAKTVELTLYPAKIPESAQNYQLLPKTEQQVDADAMPLYEKAVESMPKDFNSEQIRKWLEQSIEKFPQKNAEELVQKHLDSLKLVAQAARCKECNWSDWKPGEDSIEMSGCKNLAFVIRLWARLEISRGQFNGAVVAMQTGFGMARHWGQGPTIIHGLVGINVGSLMCGEIEQFVQQKDSPNLYWALANLPRPFIDIEKAIEIEKKFILDLPPNDVRREQTAEQKEAALDRVRSISKRLDNSVNGLQCVEAIRHYAAIHEGQLPEKLSDISDIEVPNDLISGEAFEYSRTDAGAILKSEIPEGGKEKDSTRYEIMLKK